MGLGGLWHGAGWTFVLWGLLHGAYLVVNHVWRAVLPFPGRPWWWRGASWALTFAAVVVAWVLFRAESMTGAVTILEGMAGLNGVLLGENHRIYLGPLASVAESLGIRFVPTVGFSVWSLPWMAGCLALILGAPNTVEWVLGPERVGLARLHPLLAWRPRWVWAVLTGVAAVACIGMLDKPSEFLYFNF